MLPELRDGRMATNVLNSEAQVLTPTQERILCETLKCLKQENIVRFMMDTSTDPDRQVSEESISCALDALATTDLEKTIVPSKIEGEAENALMTGLTGMLGTAMIISYCLSDEEWERLESGRLEPGLYGTQDRTALRCAIDAQGGPRKYMENMMNPGPEAMDKMIETDISCQPQEETNQPEEGDSQPEEGEGQPEEEDGQPGPETGPQTDPDENQGGQD